MHAERSMCYACVNSFLKEIIRHRLSQDLLNQFLTSFSANVSFLNVVWGAEPLFPIRRGMLPWQPIFGKIGELCQSIKKLTFIRHAGVPKRILSQFWY